MDLAFGGAVPEPSAWAMMFVGSAGLGYAGCRRARGVRSARRLIGRSSKNHNREGSPKRWPILSRQSSMLSG